MQMMLTKLKNLILNSMRYNTEEAKPYFMELGWVLIITSPGFYFFNAIIAAPGGYENMPLRIAIAICGVFLVSYKHVSKYIGESLPIIFYFILLFSFPFFFIFMLLNNQDQSSWQVIGLIGLVLLSFFVDYISFIILTIIGVGLAFLLADKGNNIENGANLLGIFGSYSAPIIYLIIFTKKREELRREKNSFLLKIEDLNDKLEIQVKNRTIELEKALQAKTEFLNNISHEIRTPIQGFTILSEGLVLHWNNFSEEKKLTLATQVSINANRLATLLTNLLDLSKFTADKMVMAFKQINTIMMIENIIDECRKLYINEKKIDIIFNNYAQNTKLIGDEERLTQVLRNIISNAIKFSPNNSSIEIVINNMKDVDGNKAMHFSITDSGIAIPEDEIESIFEPFTQSSRTKTAAGGTGLGLSICKEIVNAHNGKIWASNNSSCGSSFHFVIPMYQELS
jgi:two-component system, sensor histidine kinase ChiS